eukprot:scaffold8123_cov66-Phaeocystis_antarctica.AAC.13
MVTAGSKPREVATTCVVILSTVTDATAKPGRPSRGATSVSHGPGDQDSSSAFLAAITTAGVVHDMVACRCLSGRQDAAWERCSSVAKTCGELQPQS